MRKTNIHLVTEADFDGVMIGSEEWQQWLQTIKSFRYQPGQYGRTLRFDITVRNRCGNYWYAYRKVNGKLRQYYLGKAIDLDYERLQNAVDYLSLDDVNYWRQKRERKEVIQAKCTTKGRHKELEARIVELESLCNELQSENQLLKSQIA